MVLYVFKNCSREQFSKTRTKHTLYFSILTRNFFNFSRFAQGWGVTVTLGVPKVNPEISAHYGLLLSGRTLRGSLYGGWRPKSDLHSLVDMYMRKVRTTIYLTVDFTFSFSLCLSHHQNRSCCWSLKSYRFSKNP